MKVIKVDNVSEWLKLRHDTGIGGSDAKGVYPLQRGEDRTPMGQWDLVGQMLTRYSEIGNAMQRGHDLEDDAITELEKILDLTFDHKPGVWIADSGKAFVTPDAAEQSDKPTYSAEIKHLSAGKHFKHLYKMRTFVGNPINLVPDEKGAFYREQTLQYFTVNPNLQWHYFVMRHPDAIHKEHETLVVKIHRSDVEHLIAKHDEVLNQAIAKARRIVGELTEDLF